jgi:hypothetical protein
MQREDVHGLRRLQARWGILLGLLAMGLSIVAALLVSPKAAQGDPISKGGCTVQLTGSTVLLFIDQAEFTFTCNGLGTTNKVTELVLESDTDNDNTPTGDDKSFIAVDQADYVCAPDTMGASSTCEANPVTNPTGSTSGTFTIFTQDACGDQDGTPLTFDVALTGGGVQPTTVEINDLEIQCEETPPTTTTTPTGTTPTGTTPTTTTPSASGLPGGTGGGTGGGAGGVSGAQDNGQVPVGGVQSGAGGTAPADDGGAGLLAAVGLMLAATLGLGIARVRSGRG